MNNQIIQNEKEQQVTEILKKYAEMNSTEFYLFVSERLRNYISERDGQKHHYINIVDQVSISMNENCFDTFTLQQIVKRMSKIANILNRFNKESIIEMNYHQFCNEISVDVKELKVLFNMKELADMNLTTIVQNKKHKYNEKTQKFRKTPLTTLNFTFDVTKETGWVKPQN